MQGALIPATALGFESKVQLVVVIDQTTARAAKHFYYIRK
jgi:hypothetical protein